MSHIVCLIDAEPDRATFTWSEGPAAFEPYTLDRIVFQEYKEYVLAARKCLADLVKDSLQDEQNLPISAYLLAKAGYELYEAMFDPDAEHASRARRVRRWLEKLVNQQSVDSFEVVVESPWTLPLNIIYDREPNEEEFLSNNDDPERWQPFWGLRFNLAGGRRVDPLRRVPLLKNPNLLMVVDAEIRNGLPEDQRQRLAAFAEAHHLAIIQTKPELEKAIRARRPDILYWLSHATPEALTLGEDEICPRQMRKLLRQDDEDHFGGLAFLNACQTAEAGPSGSFFEAFHSVGFAGMIGTENQTVDQFANPLGLDFLEAVLDRGEPVGAALRDLRGRVPLGLLYGTYCPPGIRVDLGQEHDVPVVKQVRVTGVALGKAVSSGVSASAPAPLPDEPYLSLAYYDRSHRALFAGRDDDIERFAKFLDDACTRILILHGESGVGKSSFLRAGVIPYLEEECLGYRFLRDAEGAAGGVAGTQSPVIFIRATNDLFGQIALALCHLCAKPYRYRTPEGSEVSTDLPAVLRDLAGDTFPGVVRDALLADPSLLGRALSTLGGILPFMPILVIDQSEEIFTLSLTPEDQARGRQALQMLRRAVDAPAGFKLIVSLRTEYFGRLIDRLRRGLHDTGGISDYFLTDFDEKALVEAIQRPTSTEPILYASEIPFTKYGFRYADGVAEEIARRVLGHRTRRSDSLLPLLQVICTQLHRIATLRDDRVILVSDLEAIGGVEGGLRRHIEQQVVRIVPRPPSEQVAFKKLVTRLYLRQPDGSLTTALLPDDDLEAHWGGRTPFGEVLHAADDQRILRISSLRIGDQEERRYVSLGHDALAKLAAQWDEELTRKERWARRLRKALAWASAAAAVLLIVGVILLSMKRSNDRKVARNDVEALLQARPAAVQFAIKVIQPLESYAAGFLADCFRDSSRYSTAQRLHAACALAAFGRSDPEVTRFLADCIPESEASESINIVTALRQDQAWALPLVRRRWEGEPDPILKCRWAVAALSLGENHPVIAMLEPGKDQSARAGFIENFKAWPGDLSSLQPLLGDESDPATRSGLCAAVGKIPRKSLSPDDAIRLPAALDRLHRSALDGGTHSASGSALKGWNVATPELAATPAPSKGIGWHVNTLGMTMLHVNEGIFRMGSEKGEENEQPLRKVGVRPFLLGDREVSVEQFERFTLDPKCPAVDKPANWNGPGLEQSPLRTCPIQPVNREDAILFCNWMSRREGLTVCYRRAEGGGGWVVNPAAGGYRLPTEEEWEYACRAGSETEYSCGDEATYLPSYAVISNQGVAEPCASRLPNAWGFFDLHGNVAEWCQGSYNTRNDGPGGAGSAPATVSDGVVRGGTFYDGSWEARSAARNGVPSAARYRTRGFRVARSQG